MTTDRGPQPSWPLADVDFSAGRPGGASTASVLSSLVIQLIVVTAMGRVAATYVCEQGVFGAGPKEIESMH